MNQTEGITSPFFDQEIKEVVWNCGGDKCPAPDGFNFNFIKAFWRVLKPEFRRFVDEIDFHGRFPRGSNASFMALIPKTSHPQSLNDYRPISLIGCMYKVIAKLLANRLRSVISGIEASWENVLVLKAMLRGFEMASGLKINYAKTQFGIFGQCCYLILYCRVVIRCIALMYKSPAVLLVLLCLL